LKLVEKTVEQLVREVASPSPTPGGGSVAAVMGALGGALGIMACNHALKGKQVDTGAVRELLARLEELVSQFLLAVDADTAAFNGVMAALAIPKTEAEARQAALSAATRGATVVPLQVAVNAAAAMGIFARLTGHARKAVSSDLGAGLQALAGCLGAAAYNVETNLPGVGDPSFAAAAVHDLQQARREADHHYLVVKQWVEGHLR
jgi:formiminotetrahydrofolate cyclodeaminase